MVATERSENDRFEEGKQTAQLGSVKPICPGALTRGESKNKARRTDLAPSAVYQLISRNRRTTSSMFSRLLNADTR